MPLLETVSYQFGDFLDFLKERNIINTGVAFVLAIQVNNFFLNIVNEIVNPIASKITSEDFNKKQFEIFGIKIRIGLLFLNLVNLLFTLIFIYYLWKFSETTPGIINKVYSSIRSSVKTILN